MPVTCHKLWMLLTGRNMNRTQRRGAARIRTNAVAKPTAGER